MLCISGCPQPEPDPVQNPLEGIKITDLASLYPEDVPPQIMFQVFSFEMPAENCYLLQEIFGGLYQRSINFADYQMFQANAILTGFGLPAMWDRIAQKLTQGRAQRMMANALIIFDETGEDIAAVPINYEQTIFYNDAENNVVGRSLHDGALVWNIRARPISSVKGVAQVHIEPVFRRSADMAFSHLGEKTIAEDNEFAFAGFHLNMSAGEFVLLGPEKYQSDRITLSSLFFTVEKDEPAIRLYLIVCTGVSN